MTTKISCNKFETFVVTLSRNCHGFGKLNCRHSQIQSIRATAARCFVASSALTSGRLLRSLYFSTVALSYFDNFPHPTRATMNARVFDRVVLQYRSRPIPVFYRERRLSSPCRHLLPSTLLPIHTISTIVCSTTSDLLVALCTANRPHVRKGKCLVYQVETHLDG